MMSVIHPLQPRQERHICPDCGAPEGLSKNANNGIVCKLCGWQATEPIGTIEVDLPDEQPLNDESDIRDLRHFRFISYYVQNRDRVTVWGMSAYESALDHIRNREWDAAIEDLYRALDMDYGLTEAHIWLGRLLTDEKKQREHLAKAIKSPESLLEIMYLDGRISLTQLENALYGTREVQTKIAQNPVESETVVLTCLVCGGHMTAHPITGHVECAYCGHIEEPASEDTPSETLSTALWLKQAEGTQWVIEERIIHCENCGADRTLTDEYIGAYCLYCGSQHIIVRDALNSFRQPDGMIPFKIPQQKAEQAIYDRLFERWERFKGTFVNNKVKEATFTGVYLPFWIFNIQLESQAVSGSQRYLETFKDYAFPAVTTPSPRLIEKINFYDLSMLQGYTPSALARYSAEMYKIDFDKASLEVRGHIRQLLRDKYSNGDSILEVSHRWSVMNDVTFQLALLPVWIATLIEDDDDVRIGLVNGQTGHAVLGKARKPNHYR